MKAKRTEQQTIAKDNPMWKIIDQYCFRSKNLYNEANYLIRQEFINNGNWIRAYDLDKSMKDLDVFKLVGSQPAQKTIFLLDKNWKSFFKGMSEWKVNPEKFLGRPHLPKYLKKNGRYVLMLKNIQCRLEEGYLVFSWKPLKDFTFKTNAYGKLIQVRFIPKGSCYTMEIVYEIDVPEPQKSNNRVCGIDIGVNNLATVANNIGIKPFIVNGKTLKSINQYYNKKKTVIQSELKTKNHKDWSKRLEQLTTKRYNKIKDYMHKASKYVVDWCVLNNIDTIVIGNNPEWKQGSNLRKTVNQTFVQIPFSMLIKQITYKGENNGIKVIVNGESYTSGTSFLDNEEPIKQNYNKSRRYPRGLFTSNNGIKINSDLNGAYQIIKKVIPEAFVEGIEGAGLHPVRINV